MSFGWMCGIIRMAAGRKNPRPRRTRVTHNTGEFRSTLTHVPEPSRSILDFTREPFRAKTSSHSMGHHRPRIAMEINFVECKWDLPTFRCIGVGYARAPHDPAACAHSHDLSVRILRAFRKISLYYYGCYGARGRWGPGGEGGANVCYSDYLVAVIILLEWASHNKSDVKCINAHELVGCDR